MPVAPVPALDQRLEALVHAIVLPDEDAAAFCHSLLGYLRRFQPVEPSAEPRETVDLPNELPPSAGPTVTKHAT
jgi:hypothetical protein